MPPDISNLDESDFFNTPVDAAPNSTSSRSNGGDTNEGDGNSESVPRPKRIACTLCRKRKLKCDGTKPSCGTCSRLGHNCEYDEVRKKSGPKRGYVKLLEARLKQVETLLESRDTNEPNPNIPANASPEKIGMASNGSSNQGDNTMQGVIPDTNFQDPSLGMMTDFGMSNSDDFSWEMIGLGLEEALPNPEVMDEMTSLYFEKIHPSFPMIHRGRFMAAMDLAPHMRPAVCLRYAMWTHACSVTPRYHALAEHFYARARKYAELDELRGQGESVVSIAHCQCWTLLACHEFKLMYFPRAWLSIGRAARLAQMLGLHRLDRIGLDVKQTLPPPRDWTEREERRRTFWMAYCQDRYASIGTGWPMTIDERDILTNLPCNDSAFMKGQAEQTGTLADVMNGEGLSTISSFASVVVLSTVYGRNLTHLHRPNENDNDEDLNGDFWKRHRTLDNILLKISLSLPNCLRLPAGLGDPNTIFANMNIHTATICLHQAAIFKADKNKLPAQISAESKRRCIVAADQVSIIMKMISHLDLSMMNPFLAFNLYVAARVFVQYLKSRREDIAIKSSLHFLLSAMEVLRHLNPLTESFLVQLDVDLEGSGLDVPNSTARFPYRRPPGESPANTDAMKCSPLFEIRQTQNNGQSAKDPNATQLSQDGGSYPSLYATPGESPTTTTLPHHMRQTNVTMPSFEGSDPMLGSNQNGQYSGTSPGFGSSEDGLSRSQSNHPTPSTVSNRTSSYAGLTPPQVSSNNFPTTTAPPPERTTHAPNHGILHGFGPAWTSTTGMEESKPNVTSPENPDLSFIVPEMTPGPTGMTPLPDALWNNNNMIDGNDWMFNWTSSGQ